MQLTVEVLIQILILIKISILLLYHIYTTYFCLDDHHQVRWNCSGETAAVYAPS
jgi:hypothetical protein